MRNNDFRVHLCLISESSDVLAFVTKVRTELEQLYRGKGSIYLDVKTEDVLEMIIAEIQGSNQYDSEEEALLYLIESCSDQLMSWIHGYHIQIEPKTVVCAYDHK
jgi:hypothetical protein